MIEIKKLSPGDHVKIKTKVKTWQGNILESYDTEIILLKLESGYNIGIRQSDIKDVEVLEKYTKQKDENITQTKNETLRNVAMIITGGTISSRLDPKSGGVKWTSVKDLFTIAPELQNICNITKIKKPFMKASEDMSPKDWQIIAKEAHELLLDKDVDGIIITHGTDTLHYTAAALSFFIQNLNKPIALTYSQRSIDRGSTDAHLNLIAAAQFAVSDIAEIAVIGHHNLDDKSCQALPATKCRKMHATRRDTFKVINDEPIATITKDHIEITKSFNPRNDNKPKLDTKYNEKVALIKVHPGQDPHILEFYAKEGYKGIILEATGLGHIPGKASTNNWLPTVKKLIKKGIIICAAPQTLYGALNPNVYASGRDIQKTGIIFLKDMLPETALVKLGWILGHKSWYYNDKNADEKMLHNFAGEFNDKLTFDDFS